ncbi:hypothetical protein NA57DRAFT_73076 [Rhizodiscina lignyota]|uniref:Uncharacterized protein n=1 Tax=Rhizodiscina lignyota TaxID=1504668 RepID=A0A9P4M8F7_9PEZI|nr:hypothetical protein NA57DRAFT_73076 [Rhizodiscina lignyota]
MAAFARPSGPAAPSTPFNPHRATSNSTPRSLPRGRCNYQDLSRGTQAPVCGCRRFWQDSSRAVSQQANALHRATSDDASYICFCSHHACFHDERPQQDKAVVDSSPLQAALTDKSPVFLQLASSNGGDTRFQLMAGSHPVSLRGVEHGKRLGVVITTPRNGANGAQAAHGDRPSSVVARFEQQAAAGSHRIVEQLSSQPDSPERQREAPNGVQANTSHPPGNEHRYRPQANHTQNGNSYVERQNNAISGFPHGPSSRPPSIAAGLGLSLQGRSMGGAPFDQSPTPTVPDDPLEMANLLSMFPSESLPSTVNPSVDVPLHRNTPNRDFIQHALNMRNMGPPLEIPLDLPTEAGIPNGLLSATELNTPSIKATPDLTEIQRYVQEATSLAEDVSIQAAAINQAGQRNDLPRNSASHIDAPAMDAPNAQQGPDNASNALQRLPTTLQQLLQPLNRLLDHLKVYPNFSTLLQGLSQRVDALQNVSFEHVTPEELQNRFDFFEGRVLELEGRVKEHDDFHTAMEDDQTSLSRSRRYHTAQPDIGASFGSNISAHSVTSSALIQAAIDRQETEAKLMDIQERLEVLEATELPSAARPWEIEVVLFPWGRQLRGIWMSSDEGDEEYTQVSSEWTSHSLKSSAIRSASHSFNSAHSGWTNEAIYDWADASSKAWLVPRACGLSTTAYKRLRSRGFVRKITLSSGGARELHKALHHAFRGVLEAHGADRHEASFGDDADYHPAKSLLGLQESIIPLRKVRKSHRLRFLSPSELVSPALWDAQFLASDTLMRVPGGSKRLFVTTKAAYFQRVGEDEQLELTWQSLRELPRVVDAGTDATTDGGQAPGVGEADARELCWAWNPAFDPPQSVHSSFASSFSGTSERQQPVQLSPNTNVRHPHDIPTLPARMNLVLEPRALITPLSEQPPQHHHQRTASSPLVNSFSASAPAPASGQSLSRHKEAAKRRVASFEQARAADSQVPRRRNTIGARSGEPERLSPRPSVHRVSQSPPKMRESKRRRITQASGTTSAASSLRSARAGPSNGQESTRSAIFDRTIRLTHNAESDWPSDSEYNMSLYTHGTSQIQIKDSPRKVHQPTPRRSRDPPSPFVTLVDAPASRGYDSRAGPSSAGGLSNVDAAYAAWRKGENEGPAIPYATPYSAGGPLGGYGYFGGDTQADSVSLAEREPDAAASAEGPSAMEIEVEEEEVWEGVEGSEGGDDDHEEDMDDTEESEFFEHDDDVDDESGNDEEL